MSANRKLRIDAILGSKLLLSALLVSGTGHAEEFDAGKVMKDMKVDEQYAYVAGIVEGLAIARYNKDAKSKGGMGCIYDWFYKDKQNKKVVMDAFDRYPTYPPGSIVDVLVKRKCGE